MSEVFAGKLYSQHLSSFTLEHRYQAFDAPCHVIGLYRDRFEDKKTRYEAKSAKRRTQSVERSSGPQRGGTGLAFWILR